MCDNWEDWDNIDVPLVKTIEQLKQLEERKLIEKSDNDLAVNLFQDEDSKEDEISKNEIEQLMKCVPLLINKPIKVFNKQKENEEKQKTLSKILKEEKAKKKLEKELYGEAEYEDEYADYENQFY